MPLNPLPSRLGKGPAYPFRFDEVGQVELRSEEEEVKSCLTRLLSTAPGEDPFLYKNGVPYGVRVSRAMFVDEETAKTILTFDTKLAIDAWEPRVQLLALNFSSERLSKNGNGSLKINVIISFRYRASGRADNLVVAYVAPLVEDRHNAPVSRYVVPLPGLREHHRGRHRFCDERVPTRTLDGLQ